VQGGRYPEGSRVYETDYYGWLRGADPDHYAHCIRIEQILLHGLAETLLTEVFLVFSLVFPAGFSQYPRPHIALYQARRSARNGQNERATPRNTT